jgi:RNA polymerase sigma-70 factor, ECF subfamily
MPPAILFERQRKRLLSLAYGFLGSLVEAEDVVQDAYVRVKQAATDSVRNPEAWLTTVVSRIAIDRLRSAKRRRETYPGEWLPEPVLQSTSQEQDAITQSRLSIALLYLLEKLEPEQRAVFLLREVFDHSYKTIAEIVGKSEAACRQIMTRTRVMLEATRPGALTPTPVSNSLVSEVLNALTAGDEQTLLQLIAPEAVLITDGGGKVPSAMNPIYGVDRILRFFFGLRRKYGDVFAFLPATVNSEPGFTTKKNGHFFSVAAFAVEQGRVAAIYSVSNPDKLAPR